MAYRAIPVKPYFRSEIAKHDVALTIRVGVGTVGAVSAAAPQYLASGCSQCIMHPQCSETKTLFYQT